MSALGGKADIDFSLGQSSICLSININIYNTGYIMPSSLSTLPYILVLYGIGVGLHFLFRGNFRTGLVILSALLSLLYVSLFVALSSPGKGQNEFDSFGTGMFLLFASMIGLPALGVLFAAIGNKVSEKMVGKNRIAWVAIGIILIPPAFVTWDKISKDNAQAELMEKYNQVPKK